MEVIGAELQQVYDFYDQLRQDREYIQPLASNWTVSATSS